jgi:iron complex outermembrane receptor protein
MSTTTLRGCLLAATAIATAVAANRPALAQDEPHGQELAQTNDQSSPSGAVPQSPVTLPEVRAYGDAGKPNQVILEPAVDNLFPATDASDLLQSVPGVSMGRMGGHGTEPYIRGQSQTRLNIIDDGAFIHGGCPNRMDPPTAYLTADGIDSLIVDKGYASVTNGPGGAGGTVRAKRKVPVFTQDKRYQGSVFGGLKSNAWTRNAGGDVAVGTDWGYLRAEGNYEFAQDYRDGADASVRSSFSSHGGRIEMGLTPTADDLFRVSLQNERIDDALFAGAGMDSPYSETFVLRASYAHDFDPGGTFRKIETSAYGGIVDHIMDNYSLRTRTGNVMKVDSGSDTFGGNLALTGETSGFRFKVGGDVQINRRDATRFMGARELVNDGDESRIQSYSWPGVSLSQTGLFAEVERTIMPGHDVIAGVRYDRVGFSADKADRVAIMPGQSANTLFQNYYGVRADDRHENNFGGLLRYEVAVDRNVKMFAGVSRSVRTADTSERSLAQNNATASSRWVGRPDISPEKHHQIDIGAEASMGNWTVGGSVYYDRVQDYILRDLARGQDGVLLSDDATIYRNVNATLTGFEVSGKVRLPESWTVAAQTAFTYGQNEEDDRPLAQIPPLELTATVEKRTTDWMMGLRMRAAYRQPRADVGNDGNSGVDVGKTGGYAVFDLYGEVLAFEPMTISLGVTNLFDKVYANHLSRSNSFDPDVVQVNEPGRSFFIRAHATF